MFQRLSEMLWLWVLGRVMAFCGIACRMTCFLGPEPWRSGLSGSIVLGPVGAWWLGECFGQGVRAPFDHRLGRGVVEGSRVRLDFVSSCGMGRRAVRTGHVIAVTGFEPGLNRMDLLESSVRERLRAAGAGRIPELDRGSGPRCPGSSSSACSRHPAPVCPERSPTAAVRSGDSGLSQNVHKSISDTRSGVSEIGR